MSRTSTFEIKGMKELGERLKQLPDAVKRVARPALFAGAKVSLASIQAGAPVKTGLLRDSIRIARRTRGVPDTQIQYVIFIRTRSRQSIKLARQKGKGVSPGQAGYAKFVGPYYWVFLEFGTSKMAARPFFLPGFERSATNAGTTIRDVAATRLGIEVAKLKG